MSGHSFDCVQRVHQSFAFVLHFLAALAEGLRNRQQDLLKAGTPEAILRREVGSAEKRFAIRRQEDSERPAPCPLIAATAVW